MSKLDVDKLFSCLVVQWEDGTSAKIVRCESSSVVVNFILSSGKLSFSGLYELFSESGVLMLYYVFVSVF